MGKLTPRDREKQIHLVYVGLTLRVTENFVEVFKSGFTRMAFVTAATSAAAAAAAVLAFLFRRRRRPIYKAALKEEGGTLVGGVSVGLVVGCSVQKEVRFRWHHHRSLLQDLHM